jgi:shikimate kinase
VLALDVRNAVIATGGSVVYGARAISHLRAHGHVVHLTLPLPALEVRLGSLAARGVVLAPGQTLAALHAERTPLYEACADATLDTSGLSHDEVVSALAEGGRR